MQTIFDTMSSAPLQTFVRELGYRQDCPPRREGRRTKITLSIVRGGSRNAQPDLRHPPNPPLPFVLLHQRTTTSHFATDIGAPRTTHRATGSEKLYCLQRRKASGRIPSSPRRLETKLGLHADMQVDEEYLPPQQQQQSQQQLQQQWNLQPTNALAGPSTIPGHYTPPVVYLPPAPAFERRAPKLTSTEDLISRFQLLPAYDRYVRPYATPVSQVGASSSGSTLSAIDKGKGKERDTGFGPPATPGAATTGHTPAAAVQEGEEETAEGKTGVGGAGAGAGGAEKKWKSNYKHLIKGIPDVNGDSYALALRIGKHSMKKDDYLMTMMQVPPKQVNRIVPFDLRTQRESFAVSLEGLKGWNMSALVGESPQAREDRKRRKELKKLAKAQAQGQVPGTNTGTPASGLPQTPSAIPAITNASTSAPSLAQPQTQTQTQVGRTGTPVRTGTPQPGRSATPRPGQGQVPSQPQTQTVKRSGTPAGVSTPKSASTPVPPPIISSSSQPHPHPQAQPQHQPQQYGGQQNQVSTPAATPTPTASSVSMSGVGTGGARQKMGVPDMIRRGVKREREDSSASSSNPRPHPNPHGHAPYNGGVMNNTGNTTAQGVGVGAGAGAGAGGVAGVGMGGGAGGAGGMMGVGGTKSHVPMMMNSKAGMNGIRPRKKQRLFVSLSGVEDLPDDPQSQPRSQGQFPVQQPTPHA
ncbi:hypothetical protein K474DRAFT_1674977 [Panus rudis PR-1116 ss-1]|nr:hypothetical protein K474DRAFT_1674977 [Panus rudis PR-1116 ss-1]